MDSAVSVDAESAGLARGAARLRGVRDRQLSNERDGIVRGAVGRLQVVQKRLQHCAHLRTPTHQHGEQRLQQGERQRSAAAQGALGSDERVELSVHRL